MDDSRDSLRYTSDTWMIIGLNLGCARSDIRTFRLGIRIHPDVCIVYVSQPFFIGRGGRERYQRRQMSYTLSNHIAASMLFLL